MFDPATTALLRAVLDEVGEQVSRSESGTRPRGVQDPGSRHDR